MKGLLPALSKLFACPVHYISGRPQLRPPVYSVLHLRETLTVALSAVGRGMGRNLAECLDNLHIAPEGGYRHTSSTADKATVNVSTKVENRNIQAGSAAVYTYYNGQDRQKATQSREQPLSLAVNG